MFGTARANGAEQGDQKNDRGEDRNQHPANPFSSFLVGEQRSGGFRNCGNSNSYGVHLLFFTK